MTNGVRGERAQPVDVWAVAGGTMAVMGGTCVERDCLRGTGAWVHTKVQVDGRLDSLLGGPADEQAVAGGAVAVTGGHRGGQRVQRPGGSVPGGGGTDSLLGGPVDEWAMADGAVAAALTRSRGR